MKNSATPQLIGKWKDESEGYPIIWSFFPNGKGDSTEEPDCKDFTYSLTGNNLTLTFNEDKCFGYSIFNYGNVRIAGNKLKLNFIDSGGEVRPQVWIRVK